MFSQKHVLLGGGIELYSQVRYSLRNSTVGAPSILSYNVVFLPKSGIALGGNIRTVQTLI